jgi:hypothetical protein
MVESGGGVVVNEEPRNTWDCKRQSQSLTPTSRLAKRRNEVVNQAQSNLRRRDEHFFWP